MDQMLSEPKCQATFEMSPKVGGLTFPLPRWGRYNSRCCAKGKEKRKAGNLPFHRQLSLHLFPSLGLSKALGETQPSKSETPLSRARQGGRLAMKRQQWSR